MASFIKDNFLLKSAIAEELYYLFAKDQPIIDYHSHLSPSAIANNIKFKNITDIWLKGDHYKWRAMRALGIEEQYITGDADDREKFQKWAETVPYTLRNPLYHWTHMELKNPFGIDLLLNGDTAAQIYEETKLKLQDDSFSTQNLLRHFNVEMVGTTDDPADDLHDHLTLMKSTFDIKVLPTFRPDNIFNIHEGDEFRRYVKRLSGVSNVPITDLDSLIAAYAQRMEAFKRAGCLAADHGLAAMPAEGKYDKLALDKAFSALLNGDDNRGNEIKDGFTFYVLKELCKLYHEQGWIQQFHLGAQRNNNSYKLYALGADTGFDSIGDHQQAETLSRFLDALESEQRLAKTILYNLNPAHNTVFATMAGNFQGEGIRSKIQYGSAWWFLDQLDGMTEQINTLSNQGLISCFIGMLTDSRSFLSYSRHDYFRRLLCNLFAEDIIKGYIPHDIKWIGNIITDICYRNAKNYFELSRK